MDKQKASNKKLENALDYSLKLLNSGMSVEECLKLYPNQRKELKDLLETAACVKSAYPGYPELRPSKLYAKTGRAKFLAAIEGEVPQAIHTAGERRDSAAPGLAVLRGLRRRVLIASAAAAAALLMTTGGLVYASGDSLPGSALYGVKRTAENVQLTFTLNPESRAKLHYEFAQRRIDEAKRMAKTGQGMQAAGVVKDAKDSFAEAKKVAEVVSPTEQDKIELEIDLLDTTANKKVTEGVEPEDSIEATTTGKPNDDKVALNKDADTPAPDVFTPAITTRRERAIGSVGVAPGNKSQASLIPFEINAIKLSDEYISPNGDGEKDTVLIRVDGATEEGFKVGLYKGSTRVTLIAEQTSGRNLEFKWDGKDIEGNRLPDGEYTLKVSNSVGQVAHSKSKITVDTTPPAITLTEPPANIETNILQPRFVWQTDEEGVECTLRLSMDVIDREFHGLTDNFFIPQSALMQGSWTWNVTAIDKAGNKSTSETRSINIVRDSLRKQ